jgi:hypothetical protein
MKMKRSKLILFLGCLLLAVSLSVYAQPTSAPAPAAPVTKVATPAPAPVAPAAKVATPSPAPTAEPLPAAEPVPAAAPAAPPADPAPVVKAEEGLSWWKLILKHLMDIVFSIVGIMIAVFVRVLMKKYGFESQSAQVNDVLMKAVGWAEQKSIKAAKLDGKPIESAKKMEMAIEFAKTMAKEYKLPDKGADWWEEKLESWLGVNGQS